MHDGVCVTVTSLCSPFSNNLSNQSCISFQMNLLIKRLQPSPISTSWDKSQPSAAHRIYSLGNRDPNNKKEEGCRIYGQVIIYCIM